MKTVNGRGDTYFDELKRRSKRSRAHTPYQLIGLNLAAILKDKKHKSLYMKLAKKENHQELLRLAKSIAENPAIKNLGAYFMSVLKAQKLGPKKYENSKNRR